MSKLNIKEIVESLIDTFFHAGKISLDLRNNGLTKKIKSDNAEILYDNEIKLKELELKYNAQIDSQQIKADADLNKMLIAESTKDFREAAKQSQEVQDQVSKLYGQGSTGKTPTGSEPVKQS